MPPRFAYWTILIDGKPTAFRAREKEELLPTFNQLRRKSQDVVLKWFARGRLWASQEEAFAEQRKPKAPSAAEPRGKGWRPGGQHRDPRDRFKRGNRDGDRHAVGGSPKNAGRPHDSRSTGPRPLPLGPRPHAPPPP